MIEFFTYLFGEREGWACLGWLDGDPRLGELDAKHQEWYAWPENRETLIRRAEWHAAQGHNVYVRQVLFSKKSGTKAAALPSNIIWQDEAKADTPASLLIETSPGNYQALIRLDRPASTAERKRLMTAWRAGRPSADDCSSDPVHFVRVPGGINRKGAGGSGTWRVRAVARVEKPYPTERLLARCRARGVGETHPTRPLGALDQAQLDYWQAHVEQLLNSDRTLPRAFVRDTPGRRILEARALGKGTLFHASGTWDASRERLWLANSMVMARYLDEQIAALLWHFEVAETVEIKGDAAIWADIQRVITMARAAHPHVMPRLYGPRPAHKPAIARGRASNHAKTIEQVYSLLVDHKAGADAIITIGALAGQLGCHRRTISTALAQLKAAGRIAWRRLGQHGGLVVSFISDVIIEQPASAVQAVPAPQIDAAPAALGETDLPVGCVSPDRDADHISEPPTLAELARDYLSDPASGRRVDVATGQIMSRRTAKHFADLVTAEYAYTADDARAAYKAEQQRLDELERQEWQRFFAWLRHRTDDELITYIAGRARAELVTAPIDHTEEQPVKVNKFDAHMYQTRLKCAKQHLAWRGLKMPAKPTKEQPVTPRRLLATPAPVVEQTAFTAPEQIYSAVCLIQRLRARQAVATV